MLCFQKEIPQNIIEQYKAATDSSIYSALTGKMGKIYTDETQNMSMILQGEFLFPSNAPGSFDKNIATEMLEAIQNEKDIKELIIVPQTSEWEQFFINNQAYSCISRYRLSVVKPSEFDLNKLNSYVAMLPKEFHFEKMGEKHANITYLEPWSKYFCSNFASAKEFEKDGVGVAIMLDNRMVCAATSYTVYDKGIEIEIATHPDYRQRGLATICAAKIILECVNRNLIPHWDAANLMSVQIAQKMGYELLGRYNAFCRKEN